MSTEFFNDQWRIPSNENQNKISNYSMEFDGTNEIIRFGDVNGFDRTDAFSGSCWVNLTGSDNEFILSKQDGSTFKGYMLYVNVSRYLILYIASSSTNRILIRTNSTVANNTWNHLTFTYDGSSTSAGVKLYINGVNQSLTNLGNTSITGSLLDSSVPFQISGRDGTSANGVNGKIDQVTVFDYALSASQVTQLGAEGYAFNFIPNDYIDFNNITDLNNLTAFSTSTWINYSGTPVTTSHIFLSGGTSLSNRFYIQLLSSTQIRYGSGSNFDNISITSISSGSWHNIVTVHDGTSLDIYLDGVKQNSSPVTVVAPNANIGDDFTIGRYNISPGYYWNGELSNISLWNTALTGTQVATIYNNGKPSDISSLNPVVWYKLDDTATFNSGTSVWTIPDASTNSNNGTSVGMDASNLVASNINGELVANPMSLSPKPIAYYQLGDQSVDNGANYLVPNNSLSDYVFNFGDGYYDSLVNFGTTTANFDKTDPYTFSIWIKASSNAVNQYVISKQIPNYLGYMLLLDSTMKIGAVLSHNSNARIYFVSNSAIPSNEWVHLVWTYNGNGLASGMSVYVNGAPFAITTVDDNLTSSPTNSGQLNISGRNGSFHREVNGELSNFSIFDTELSSTQITTLYNNGAPGDISSLSPTHWYKLDASAVYNSTSTEWSVDNNAYPSVYKSSLNFNGSSNYIDCGNITALNSQNAFSTSSWFKCTTPLSSSPVILNGGSSGTNLFYIQIVNSTSIRYNSAGTNKDTTVSNIADGSWHHLATVHDGTLLHIYLDGVKQNSYTITAPTSEIGNNFIIGRYTLSSLSFFNGELSNISVFNTALSTPNIETLYNNGTPEASISHSPVSWWKLDNTTTGIQDSAGSNNGTNNGATEYAGFVNELAGESLGMNSANLVVSDLQQTSGYSPYALDFDGIDDRLNCGNDSSLQITGAMTISYWLKGTSTFGSTGVGTLETLSNPGYMFGPRTTNEISFNIASTSSSLFNVATTQQITTTEWHHIVGVYTPSVSMKIYIDGQLSKTETSSIPSSQYAGGNDFVIGYRACCKIDGQISNVAIWNTDLSSSEINEIYNQGRPSNLHNFSGTAPVSWWQIGSNSSYNSGAWTCLDEIGTNNATSYGNMTNSDIVDGPGYSASGLGTSSIDIANNAPYSEVNGLSQGMDVLDRVKESPTKDQPPQPAQLAPESGYGYGVDAVGLGNIS
jgi:hypothetical protein